MKMKTNVRMKTKVNFLTVALLFGACFLTKPQGTEKVFADTNSHVKKERGGTNIGGGYNSSEFTADWCQNELNSLLDTFRHQANRKLMKYRRPLSSQPDPYEWPHSQLQEVPGE